MMNNLWTNNLLMIRLFLTVNEQKTGNYISCKQVLKNLY
jgi:hypothetical protein